MKYTQHSYWSTAFVIINSMTQIASMKKVRLAKRKC